METVRSSILCQLLAPLWRQLCAWDEGSLLAVVIRGIADLIVRWCTGSVIIQFVIREGTLDKAWKDSLLCRGLTFLINIPTKILHAIYKKFEAAFEGSFFAQLAFSVVENTPIFISWLMLAILVIPFENWNNAYSLLVYGGGLVLAVFSGMRR